MTSASVGFHCPDCVAEGARTVRGPRTVLGAEVREGRGGELVTRILVGLQVAAFVLVAAVGDPARVALGLVGSGTLDGQPVGVAHGQVWRLLTSSLVPRDAVSLLFAVGLTYLLGRQLEAEVGRWRVALLWVVAAIVGNGMAQVTLPPAVLVTGGQGATFGLLAALVVVSRRLRSNLSGLVVLAALWLVLALVQRPPDWPGPVAGAVTGALLAATLAYAPRERRTLAFGGAALVLLVVGVVAGTVAGGS
jgi:membrane associated rhomboid family serine protease